MKWSNEAVACCALCIAAASADAQHTPGAMAHTAGTVMYHAPAWSPDGAWVLVTANKDGDTEVFLIHADGHELRQLTRNTVGDDLARWSDDGRRIVFESERSGRPGLYSMLPDGSDVRVAVRDSVISRSADGATLMFESVRDGRGRLFLMPKDRSSAREIATARHAEQGSFAPHGDQIVLEQRDELHEEIRSSQIVVAQRDGSSPKVVAVGTDPSWSLDGRSILFKTWDPASQQLWVATVAPDGSQLKQLAPGVHPTWSRDGARIAFMRDRDDGGADIWVMARNGSDAHCLTCRAPFR